VARKYFSKKHEANQEILFGRDGDGQNDFSLKPTGLTPVIDFGHAKGEPNLGKTLQWGSTDTFSQEKKQQPIKGEIISSSWTLAFLPISCTKLVQPEHFVGVIG